MIPAKIAALIPRLGTPFEGEVIATRDAIGRLLKAAGLDWHDIAKACASYPTVEVVSAPSTSRPARPPYGGGTYFGDLARAARDLDRGHLTTRERCFVADMVRRGFAFRPSQRQAEWLDDILSKLQGRAAA